jgi:peptidoglycan/LPS O-acetylase OafA/YrhL
MPRQSSVLPRAHYLPTFDAWRAIAILLVIIEHVSLRLFPHSSLISISSHLGSNGVNIFFALSGFLITYLMLVEKKSKGSFCLQKFWIRRIFRIVPLAYFYFCVIALLMALGYYHVPFSVLWEAIGFYYNYYVALHYETIFFTPVGHTWSLDVEMQFYLAWSVIVWLAAGAWPRSHSFAACLFPFGAGTWGVSALRFTRGEPIFGRTTC